MGELGGNDQAECLLRAYRTQDGVVMLAFPFLCSAFHSYSSSVSMLVTLSPAAKYLVISVQPIPAANASGI